MSFRNNWMSLRKGLTKNKIFSETKPRNLIFMKRNQGFLIIISLTFTFSLFLIQSCKDEAVVETPPDPNQNPSAPKLVSPLNEATINYFTPALDWEDFNGAISYRIQISLDANFTGTMVMDSSGITSSGINIPQGLLATSSYNYWRVNASTSAGVPLNDGMPMLVVLLLQIAFAHGP